MRTLKIRKKPPSTVSAAQQQQTSSSTDATDSDSSSQDSNGATALQPAAQVDASFSRVDNSVVSTGADPTISGTESTISIQRRKRKKKITLEGLFAAMGRHAGKDGLEQFGGSMEKSSIILSTSIENSSYIISSAMENSVTSLSTDSKVAVATIEKSSFIISSAIENSVTTLSTNSKEAVETLSNEIKECASHISTEINKSATLVSTKVKESADRIASSMEKLSQRIASSMEKSSQRIASSMEKSANRIASGLEKASNGLVLSSMVFSSALLVVGGAALNMGLCDFVFRVLFVAVVFGALFVGYFEMNMRHKRGGPVLAPSSSDACPGTELHVASSELDFLDCEEIRFRLVANLIERSAAKPEVQF